MKKKIRQWIVHNFIQETWTKLFGKMIHFLRAGRILFPLIGIVGMIIVTDPAYPILQWWDFALLFVLFVGIWIGFPFFKWSYFKLWPVSVDELDDEQRHGHYRARLSGQLTGDPKKHELSDEEMEDYDNLTEMLQERYKGNFAGLWHIAPYVFVLLLVAVWFMFIFPYFNPNFISDPNIRFF